MVCPKANRFATKTEREDGGGASMGQSQHTEKETTHQLAMLQDPDWIVHKTAKNQCNSPKLHRSNPNQPQQPILCLFVLHL